MYGSATTGAATTGAATIGAVTTGVTIGAIVLLKTTDLAVSKTKDVINELNVGQ